MGVLHIASKVVDTFLKGEISHNDLDGTTIKAAKIYKTGGLEIKDTLRKCQQENEGCPYSCCWICALCGFVGIEDVLTDSATPLENIISRLR